MSTSDCRTRTDPVRASFRISVASVLWTIVSSAAAITLGVADESAVLVALGAIGLVDAAGSAALALHFLHVLHHDRISHRREVIAHRLVSTGLVTVGIASVAGGTFRLVANARTDAAFGDAAIAAASLVALVALATRKRSLAARIRDRALAGDARLSAIGAAQATVAVGGIVLTRSLDVSWADAAATVGVGVLASAVGVATWRTERETE